MRKRITTDHGSMGSNDMRQMGQHMLTNSGAAPSAFSSREVDVGDVEKLMESSSESNELSDSGDENDDAKSVTSAAPSLAPSSGKKATRSTKVKDDGKEDWFDFAKVSGKHIRTEATVLERLEISLKSLQEQCQTLLDQCVSLNPEQAGKVEGDRKLLMSRKRILDSLMCEHPAALKRLLEEFQTKAEDHSVASGVPSSSATQTRLEQLLRAPPTRSFNKLQTIAEIRAEGQNLGMFQTEASLIKLVATLADRRKPIADLRTVTIGTLGDLKRSMKDAMAEKKSPAIAKGPGKGKRAKEPPIVPGQILFDIIPEIGDAVPVLVALPTAETFVPQTPFMMKLPNAEELIGDGKAAKTSLDDFSKIFSKSSLYNSEGRAVQKLPETHGSTIAAKSCLDVIVPETVRVQTPELKKPFEGSLAWACFGFAADRLEVTSEKSWQATLRFTYQGTRSMIFTPAADVLDFMVSKGMAPPFPEKRLETFVKNMNSAGLHEYHGAGIVRE